MNFTNTNHFQPNQALVYNFLSAFSIVFGAALFSFSLIGSTIYTRVGKYENFYSGSDSESDTDDSDSNADDEDSEEEEHTQESYARLYYDELNDLEDRVLEKDELERLGNIVVKEKTPNGTVVMTYNNKSESFCYYCDDKNVSYMVLDSVARKFTIDNKCKSICVNYKAEFEKAKAAIVADTKTNVSETDSGAGAGTEDLKEPPVVKKSIYARFKNYNAPLQKKKFDNKQKLQQKQNQQPEKIYILTEKANRFTYKGKLSNYKDPNEVVTTFFNKTVDFATFKKMCIENATK
jgi:hypothetical protein